MFTQLVTILNRTRFEGERQVFYALLILRKIHPIILIHLFKDNDELIFALD